MMNVPTRTPYTVHDENFWIDCVFSAEASYYELPWWRKWFARGGRKRYTNEFALAKWAERYGRDEWHEYVFQRL